jgi:hypothetical protein
MKNIKEIHSPQEVYRKFQKVLDNLKKTIERKLQEILGGSRNLKK